MAAPWQPVPELLQQVAQIVTYSLAPDTALQKQAYMALEQHSASPEFSRYLAYVFARGAQLPPGARAVAGLTLKRVVDRAYASFPRDVAECVKGELLAALADGDASVRSAAANAIAAIARQASLQQWPALVPALTALLESGQPAAADGGLLALTHLSEDVGGQFDSVEIGRPINALLPKLVGWMGHPEEPCRRAAAAILSHFIIVQPPVLAEQLDAYLAALSKLTSDPSPGVRRVVAGSLAQLMDVYSQRVWPHLGAIQAFQLACLRDRHADVALAACDFWHSLLERMRSDLTAADHDGYDDGEERPLGGAAGAADVAAVRDTIPPPVLGELVRALLARMAYTDEDLAEMPPADLANDSGGAAGGGERWQDVRPHIHTNKESAGAGTIGSGDGAGAGGDDEDEDDDEDVGGHDGSDPHAEVQRWTVRRASASALDSLAEVYGDALLPVILPELQARLSAAGDSEPAWRAREVGVLALGAISTGCLDSMAGHAPQLWPLLVGLASGDARPLVRSIALWALSRYVPWLMEMQLLEGAPDADDEDADGPAGPVPGGECSKYCDALFGAIAARLGDGNRKVQQAVCTALVHICSEAPDLVIPYARRLVPLLGAAVSRYGAVSRVAAYDVIGALADGAGTELAAPEVAAALVPPLMERYRSLKDVDPELPPLLEALGYLFVAMGPLLGEGVAAPLFARCVALVEHDIVLAMAAAQEQDAAEAAGHATVGGGGRGLADYPLAVVALDTLGGIVEGLGPAVAPLAASAGGDRLHGLLLECIKQPPPGVRMSAFALLGELAKRAPGWLAPRAAGYIPFAAVSMRDTPLNLTACNNAIWAVGEMAVALPAAVAPHAPAVLERLGAVITNERKPSRPLLENCAVALGRLALAAPAAVAGALPAFCAAWTQCLTFVADPVERAQAYAGYAAAVERNPAPGLPLLGQMVVAFAVYADAPPDVRAATAGVLRGYQASAPAQWAEAVGRLSAQARERAAQLFGPAGVRFR